MTANLSRRIAAEFVATGFLVAAVVGSGIMAERLAGGNVAIALLANTIATGAAKSNGRKGGFKREYESMRIPESVARRVYEPLVSKAA